MWDDLNFQESIKELKKAGPRGHTLAHITPEEGQLLKAFGGSGEIDKNTGLRSYSPAAGDGNYGNNEGASPGTSSNFGSTESSGDSGDNDFYSIYNTGEFNPLGWMEQEGLDFWNNGTGQPNITPDVPEGNNNGEAERLAREAAARAEAERLEMERVARVDAAREDWQGQLQTKFDELEIADGEAAFNAAFGDDLEEDYAAAQLGLDDAYLNSSNFSEFNAPGQGLADQQTGLTGIAEEERARLATMAGNYGTHAQAAADNWYSDNYGTLQGLNTEEDFANFDFSDLDLSGFADPTSSYDPEFFKDYNKKYGDPNATYYGTGDGPDDRSQGYTDEDGVMINAIDPKTGLPRGTTVAQGPPPALNTQP